MRENPSPGDREEEDRPGGAPVAMLSYGFWQRRFAGDPRVMGSTMTLDGVVRTAVGVMPATFAHRRADVWFPGSEAQCVHLAL